MKKSTKQKLISILLVSTVLFGLRNNKETWGEEGDYLITRIVEADTPIVYFFEQSTHNYTIFLIPMIIETENPTSNNITITYGCTPYPFPQLTTNLANKSMEVSLAFTLEWITGTFTLVPGVKRDTFSFEMIIFNYPEEVENLPMGEYTLWFDYKNSSSVPVPVVCQKMIINVTETNMTYFNEYDNSTEVFDINQDTEISTTEISTTETSLKQLSVILLLVANTLFLKLRKKKSKIR